MTKEELLTPRYKVIADYPKSVYEIGTILRAGSPNGDLLYCDLAGPRMSQFPHLFKALPWWFGRTIDEMFSVKYVKVVIYRGYWRVGDIVPAELKLENWKPIGYILDRNHFQPAFELEPASEKDYQQFRLHERRG